MILVIEDDEDLRTLLVHVLRRGGFSVLAAGDGATGLRLAQEQQPDVALLDVRLPDMTGREVCRRLRASPRTEALYIILLSGLADESHRVAGFESGADDYLTKPVSMRELVLRLRAVARRLEAAQAAPSRSLPPQVRSPSPAAVPAVRVDRAAHRVWVGEEEIELTLTEYRLLAFLMANAGRLCSRAELLQKVWDMPPHLNTRTVDTHVKRVRSKLGLACGCLETVRGMGYRFQHGGAANADPAEPGAVARRS